MKVSVIVSICGSEVRNELFGYGLETLAQQTLPAQDWELILVDDRSLVDPAPVYQSYIGRLNIRHVLLDHTKHPVFREMNPGWREGEPEVFPHTPALSINVGFKLARGEVFEITQPEVLHRADALENGYEHAMREDRFVFGAMVLAGLNFNLQYFQNPDMPFEEAWSRAASSVYFDEYGNVKPVPIFEGGDMYWFLAFHKREAAFKVQGVEEEYMRGVYAEDDCYKHCLWLAGYPPIYDPQIRGVHLSHAYERHAKQKRESSLWADWARCNRQRYFEWGTQFQRALRNEIPRESVYLCNVGRKWGSLDCVREVREYLL